MASNFENDEYVSEYLIVKSSALPEVYNNVMKVKELLQSGNVSSVNEAVKRVGMSRSAFYKYRDDVQIWEDPFDQNQVTVTASFERTSDALSELILSLSTGGNKVIAVSQGLPRSGFTDVMITATLADANRDLVALRRNLNKIAGIRQVEVFAE